MVARVVSSWSLHRTLGRSSGEDTRVTGGRFIDVEPSPDALPLMDLPAALREHEYDALQLCHFHLPSQSPEYLAALRASFAASEIDLDALLIDDGDLVDPVDADQHEAWIGHWLDVAVALGAKRARISAGRSAPTPEGLQSSAERMVRLAKSHPDVRLITENWLEMLPDADSVLALREHTGDAVGLMIDLGNWKGETKYDELARIAPLAESCHAKCHFTGTEPDLEDFVACLEILKNADFSGPMALIYDGESDDEWDNLDREFAMVQEVFA